MLARAMDAARIGLAIVCYLLLVPGLLVMAFFVLRPPTMPEVCDRPERTFARERYRVEVCITSDFDTRQEFVRLRIYDHEERHLLAHRRFVFLMDYTDGEIDYLANSIRYTDATKTQNIDLPEQKFLQFPPTRWEWLTANLIRLTLEP